MNLLEIKSRAGQIKDIALRYDISDIRVFGSVSRNEANEQSDVDFLVNSRQPVSLFELGGLQMELEKLLCCKVDIVTEKGLRHRIRGQVLKEAKEI